jgi:transcriptional regulator with XRE-family HTH domain
MSIGMNIKKLREMHNLTQVELAKIAGVTDKAVSAWETETKEPRMGVIQKIADHFGIKKSNIIEDNGLDTKNQPQELSLETDLEELIGCYKVCNNEDKEELLMFARYKALKNTIAAAGGELAY